MRNKILLSVLCLFLMIALSCETQPPTQMKNNDSQEADFSKWLGDGLRVDKDGNIRVPTFLVHNDDDTTLLSFENWGIVKKAISKSSDYSWDYTIGVYNLNQSIDAGEDLTVYILPRFEPGTYDSQTCKAEARLFGIDLDAYPFYLGNVRWDSDSGDCPFTYLQNSNSTALTISDNGYAWYSTPWTSYDIATYSNCFGSSNSYHSLHLDNFNTSYDVAVDDVIFYVQY